MLTLATIPCKASQQQDQPLARPAEGQTCETNLQAETGAGKPERGHALCIRPRRLSSVPATTTTERVSNPVHPLFFAICLLTRQRSHLR